MKRFFKLYRYAKTSGLAKKRSPLSLAWFWWRNGQDFILPGEICTPAQAERTEQIIRGTETGRPGDGKDWNIPKETITRLHRGPSPETLNALLGRKFESDGHTHAKDCCCPDCCGSNY